MGMESKAVAFWCVAELHPRMNMCVSLGRMVVGMFSTVWFQQIRAANYGLPLLPSSMLTCVLKARDNPCVDFWMRVLWIQPKMLLPCPRHEIRIREIDHRRLDNSDLVQLFALRLV